MYTYIYISWGSDLGLTSVLMHIVLGKGWFCSNLRCDSLFKLLSLPVEVFPPLA